MGDLIYWTAAGVGAVSALLLLGLNEWDIKKLMYKDEDEEEGGKMENVIMKDDEIIGYVEDIEDALKADMDEETDEEFEGMRADLLKELEKHDGLVRCWYHPMGSWVVYDLVGNWKKTEE